MEPHYPIESTLDQCIKCNICITACPVAAVTDLFPGPKYAGPQAGRFRTNQQVSPDRSVDYCSGCRACNMVCPTGVKIAEMNARARAVIVAQGKVPIRLRLRNNLIARPEMMGRLAGPIAPWVNIALNQPILRLLGEAVLGLARRAPVPAFNREHFRSWFYKRQSPLRGQRKVAYFHGCSTEYYEPWIGRAATFVLEANGYEVLLPPQNCCGLPLLSNGEFPAAKVYHQENVRSLVEYARQGIPIVGTSTSCILTLKDEAPELLDLHDEGTRLVAEMTYDLSEFLLLLKVEGQLNGEFHPLPIRLGYHPPCQYRAHWLGNPGRDVLELIPGLEIFESHAVCCGVAGTYGYKIEKYDIAMQVGKSLFDFIRNNTYPATICESETCRWQIAQATQLPVFHPVELIAAAYGMQPEGKLIDILNHHQVLSQ